MFLYRRKNKIGITGNSYMEGAITVSRNIAKDSEGKLFISPPECKQLLDFFNQRYPGVTRYHNHIAHIIKEKPELIAASGQRRLFFGRPDEILTKAVAFMPQANTTYATNKALLRLWNDPENRVSIPGNPLGCVLLIQPLHQVHDALIGQFKKQETPWALPRIRGYFDNPLFIAGQNITIPFDGSYGVSWGDLNEGKI